MSATASLNDGEVPKGSTASTIQKEVDKGKGAELGLAEGMSAEGKVNDGKYSESTSASQRVVDKNKTTTN